MPRCRPSAPTARSPTVVVELKNPGLKGDQVTYDARVLQGKLPDKAEAVSLFIDVIGTLLTPVSSAGAARRAARRAVVGD